MAAKKAKKRYLLRYTHEKYFEKWVEADSETDAIEQGWREFDKKKWPTDGPGKTWSVHEYQDSNGTLTVLTSKDLDTENP